MLFNSRIKTSPNSIVNQIVMAASSQILSVNNIFIQLHNQHQAAMQDFARQLTQYDIQAGLYTQTLSRAHTHTQLDNATVCEGWCHRSLNSGLIHHSIRSHAITYDETRLRFQFAFRGTTARCALFSWALRPCDRCVTSFSRMVPSGNLYRGALTNCSLAKEKSN